jgi:predicted N-acetyltransferase YhbS
MKRSFDDPDLFSQVFDLLDVVFPGLRGAAEMAAGIGASWESVSTPFVHEEDGRIVSHIGVIERELVLLGSQVRAGSIHAVATHPDYRRRGLYRKLMEETLADCEGRLDTLILTTGNPEYYEPFGFRVLQQYGFTGRGNSSGGRDELRKLDMGSADDVALLHSLLDTSASVSEVAGYVNYRVVFCFNECENPLLYSEELGAVFVMKLEGTRLELFNIVGPRIPSLAELLERIPAPIDEVAVSFSPDRLDMDAEATPWVFERGGPDYLMVRGPFPAEGHPFTLPRSGRT